MSETPKKTKFPARQPLFPSLDHLPSSALVHELVRRHDIAVVYLYKNRVLNTREGEINLGLKCPPGDIYRVRQPLNFMLDEHESSGPPISYFNEEGNFSARLL